MKLVGLLLLICSLATSISAQSLISENTTSDQILNRRIARCFVAANERDIDDCLPVSGVTIDNFLGEALLVQVEPIPFGWVEPTGDKPLHYFIPRGLTVRDVLESVTEANRSYRWTIEGGVVNLLPSSGTPALLDVRVNHFKKEKLTNRNILISIEELPEVRQRAKELGMTGPHRFLFYWGLVDRNKYSIDCKQCTVREILNTLVRQTGYSWTYREYVEGESKTYSLK